MFQKGKLNFKKFLISLLSALMAVMLAFSVACDTTDDDDDTSDSSSSSSTTSEITDYQLIKNGDFEFGSTDKTTYPLSSSINWSKSMGSDVTVAPSSKGSSGIIDTEDTAFSKLSEKNKPAVNPKTPASFGLVTSDYDYDDEDKRVNPRADGTKILMINNNNSPVGTAQYYKASSTVAVTAGSNAMVSMWINTMDLSSVYTDKPGAYVKISSSVNAKAYDDLYIREINTNGEWAKITFAIKGSRLAKTTVGITVGLGEGNGTDQNGFVNGFVFVDNVYTEEINNEAFKEFAGDTVTTEEFDSKIISLPTTYADNSATEGDKYSTITFKLDYDEHELDGTLLANQTVNYANAISTYDYTGKGVNKIGVGNKSTATANLPEGVIGEKSNFTNYVYMNFTRQSSAVYTTEVIDVAEDSYKYVTFYAKVKANNSNANKLNVIIKDLNANEESEIVLFEAIETSKLENEETGDFIKYQAFINNPTNKDTQITLSFVFGFNEVFSDAHALQTGYAVIADIKLVDSLSKEKFEECYNLASASDYVKKQQVYGEYISYSKVTDSETESDVYGISVDKSQTFTIKEKPATNVSSYAFSSTIKDSTKLNYGIINTNYYDTTTYTYGNGVEFANELVGVKDLKESSNKHAQIVVIDNKDEGYSYFTTTPYTVTAGTSTKVNVKVKAYGSAKANVSIVSSSINENKKYETFNFKVADDKQALLSSTVTSSSYTKDGWTTVSFYITAGNEDVEFRVRIANGSEDALSLGTILFDGVTYANVDSAKILADKSALKLNFAALGSEYSFTSFMHTRAPSTVKEDGEDGEIIENTLTYLPTEVYLGNGYIKFVDYSTLFADDVIDNTTPEDETEEETEEDTGYTVSTDVTLQISSIIIALVLIGVIITIILRDYFKKRAKRKAKTQAYYEEVSNFDRNTREKTLKKIAEKKSNIALASDDDEYDYDAAQMVNEEVEETIEDVVEQATETIEEVIEEINEESTDSENE